MQCLFPVSSRLALEKKLCGLLCGLELSEQPDDTCVKTTALRPFLLPKTTALRPFLLPKTTALRPFLLPKTTALGPFWKKNLNLYQKTILYG